jgi:hypothetical protein
MRPTFSGFGLGTGLNQDDMTFYGEYNEACIPSQDLLQGIQIFSNVFCLVILTDELF